MKRYLALFALLLLPMLAWGQGNTVTLSGSGAPSGGCAFIMRYIDVVGQVEYACTTSGTWFQVGPGAAGAVSLSSTTNLTGNKQFDSGAFTLVWNTSSNSGTANPFSVADFATNTGTGYLFTVSSGSSSTIKPFRVCYRGTTNCFNFDTTTLTTSGSAVIDATKLSGNLPALNGASLTNVDAATLQTHAAAYFQQALTLTTTGTSGAATLVGGTLNIPQYTGGGGSGTVNSGSQYQIGYYAANGTTISGNTGIVTDASNNLSTTGTVTSGSGGGVSGKWTGYGSTSGSAAISVAAVAGTPSTWLMPTTDPTNGQFLQAGTPSAGSVQLSWASQSGGGNVSNVGTPTNGQIAQWTGATTIQGLATTGSGNAVLATSPTLTTPTLGVATATSINKMAITAPATSSTLAVADGKTFTVSNTLTLTGTDSSSIAFGGGGTVAYTVASGTSAMGTSAISSGTCATVVTTTATGTATTDTITYTPNADPTGVTGYAVSATGSLYIWAYPTANNVNFKVCNNTSGSLTPGALTLNWRVTR